MSGVRVSLDKARALVAQAKAEEAKAVELFKAVPGATNKRAAFNAARAQGRIAVQTLTDARADPAQRDPEPAGDRQRPEGRDSSDDPAARRWSLCVSASRCRGSGRVRSGARRRSPSASRAASGRADARSAERSRRRSRRHAGTRHRRRHASTRSTSRRSTTQLDAMQKELDSMSDALRQRLQRRAERPSTRARRRRVLRRERGRAASSGRPFSPSGAEAAPATGTPRRRRCRPRRRGRPRRCRSCAPVGSDDAQVDDGRLVEPPALARRRAP